MKKILGIILINILVFVVILAIIDVSIFTYTKLKNNNIDSEYSYLFKNPSINTEKLENFFVYNPKRYAEMDKSFIGRTPVGLEYKTKPIIIFGCSFAYGHNLAQEDSFGDKLSFLLKRPVYNRAVPGQGVQEMLYQTENPIFYEQVQKANTVIYVFIFDQYRRMYANVINYMDTWFTLHYKQKGDELIYEPYSNPFMNFIKSLYIIKYLNLKYYTDFVNNDKNKEKVISDVLLYFIKSRENLEKHWGSDEKINFYVLLYGDFAYSDYLSKKLKENGFIVLDTKKLTDIDLNNEEYLYIVDKHPTKKAWDILTPIIAEKIKESEK